MGRSNTSPITGLIFFIIIFGWEGPISLYVGVQRGETGLIILGLFITIFFWSTFGMEHLKEVYEYLRRKNKE